MISSTNFQTYLTHFSSSTRNVALMIHETFTFWNLNHNLLIRSQNLQIWSYQSWYRGNRRILQSLSEKKIIKFTHLMIYYKTGYWINYSRFFNKLLFFIVNYTFLYRRGSSNQKSIRIEWLLSLEIGAEVRLRQDISRPPRHHHLV